MAHNRGLEVHDGECMLLMRAERAKQVACCVADGGGEGSRARRRWGDMPPSLLPKRSLHPIGGRLDPQKDKNSDAIAGSRTRVARVTGGNLNRWTTTTDVCLLHALMSLWGYLNAGHWQKIGCEFAKLQFDVIFEYYTIQQTQWYRSQAERRRYEREKLPQSRRPRRLLLLVCSRLAPVTPNWRGVASCNFDRTKL